MRILSSTNRQMLPNASFGAGFEARSRISGPSGLDAQFRDLYVIQDHLRQGNLREIDPNALKFEPTPIVALGYVKGSVKIGLSEHEGKQIVVFREGQDWGARFHQLWKSGDEEVDFIRLFDGVVTQLRRFVKSGK